PTTRLSCGRQPPSLSPQWKTQKTRRTFPIKSPIHQLTNSPTHQIPTPKLSGFSPDVLEINRQLIDPAARRRDVVRELPRLVHRLGHDAEQVFAVGRRGQPLVLARLPLLVGERHAVRIEMEPRVHADVA